MKKIVKNLISISIAIAIMSGLSISVFANYSYTYTTTDDKAYTSNADPNTNGKILIFGRPICGRTNHTLHEIAESDWIETANVDVVCLNVDCADKETVLSHKELINFDLITFCYGDVSWYKYAQYIPSSEKIRGNYSLPIIVYIDKNDNVIDVTNGTKTADEIYYIMLGKYPEKKPKSLTNCKVSGVSLTYEYTGEPIKATSHMEVYSEKGRRLWKSDYDSHYYNHTYCGKYSINIEGKGDYEGTSTEVVYYIVPRATDIEKITSNQSDYITIKYKKSTGSDGYQIALSNSSEFPVESTRKIITTSYDETTIKCDGGTYYFKIRPYIVENGYRIYGKWSDLYKYTIPK